MNSSVKVIHDREAKYINLFGCRSILLPPNIATYDLDR